MPTLLLSPRHGEDSRALWRAATELGWDIHRVYNWQIPTLNTTDIAIYGEPLLCRYLSQQLCLPVIEPPLDWLPNLPDDLRKRHVRLTTLADARTIKERVFIKPADEKGLDAKIYQSGAELPAPGIFPEELPVLVQEVVTWRSEFRCFVLDSRVLTAAPYWLNNKIAQDDEHNWLSDTPELNEALEFAATILKHPAASHPTSFVLDVGLTQSRGWAAIEANAACSSGIYGCDPSAALKVIHRSCQLSQTDGIRRSQ